MKINTDISPEKREQICRALAYAASNYYDDLFLRTGNTAADNMTQLAQIFEAVWKAKQSN